MTTPHDFTAGAVLTAAQMDGLAQGRVGSGSGTSDVGPTSSTTSLDIVTCSAVTPAAANRVLKITGTWRSIAVTDVTAIMAIRLQEGATVLTEQTRKFASDTTGQEGGLIVVYVASPTAAAHTYKMTLTRVAGAGTATLQAAATYPVTIMVEDCGTA